MSQLAEELERIADILDDQERYSDATECRRAAEALRSIERVAQITAHRACCGTEHDPLNGKLHGYCVVCGIPWPCAYAGEPPK